MPTVWDSGLPVYESALIVEYLDDRWPGRGTALLPADAVARAAVRLFVARLDTAPFYKLLVSKGDEALTAASVAAIAKIEAAYGAGLRFGGPGAAGPYFLGAQFSAADVAILPFVDRFSAALPFYHGWDLLEHVPRLAAALAAVKSRPSWAATSQPPPFYIKTYEGCAYVWPTQFLALASARAAHTLRHPRCSGRVHAAALGAGGCGDVRRVTKWCRLEACACPAPPPPTGAARRCRRCAARRGQPAW